MGIFDFAEQVVKVAVRTAIIPVSLTKDIVTGADNGNCESHIEENLRKLRDDIDELPESITRKGGE